MRSDWNFSRFVRKCVEFLFEWHAIVKRALNQNQKISLISQSVFILLRKKGGLKYPFVHSMHTDFHYVKMFALPNLFWQSVYQRLVLK